MRSQPRSESDFNTKSAVVTKACLKAADILDIKNNTLAAIIGVSEATLSRLRSGGTLLNPGDKSYELAVLFVRMFRSLDAIVNGDQTVARGWIRNSNTALSGVPLTLIQTVAGLTDVIQYLDARRAVM